MDRMVKELYMATVLVVTNYGIEAPERALQAVEFAVGALDASHEVVLFLGGPATRLAVPGYAGEIDALRDGEDRVIGPTLAELLARFRAGAGQIVVAAESAQRYGVASDRVEGNAQLQPAASIVGYLTAGHVPVYI
jgi:predicted peroxiredoxin